MPYVTADDLIALSGRRKIEKLAYRLAEARTVEDAHAFLSHSSGDQGDVLDGACFVLEGAGAKVWTDKTSDNLPETTSEETARTIRKQILHCPRFVLLASYKSSYSTWVPWELGFADGAKEEYEIALFPVTTVTRGDWPRREYLGLYRFIEWGSIAGRKPEWLVTRPKGDRAMPLREWLFG